MREDHYWPDWDSDSIARISEPQRIDPVEDTFVDELFEADVRRPQSPKTRGKRVLGRVLMITGGVLVLGVILYTIDLVSSAGDVPRGVVVAGVDVGGLSRADAESKLRRELEPRLTEPVPIAAGDVRADLDPAESGLGLDWSTTLASAGHQPLDPVARIRSFFTKRQVDVETTVDADKLAQSIQRLASDRLNHPPTEGGIAFRAASNNAATPYAIEPRAGQTLDDVRGAVNLLKARWLDKSGVDLPMRFTPVKATSAGVHTALETIVLPAVAGDVLLRGDGADAVLTPAAIARSLNFVAKDGGALDVRVDPTKLKQELQPQLAKTEQDGKDAQIVFAGDAVTVQPSVDGRKIDWPNTFTPLMSVLTKPDQRELPVRYATNKPQLSTDAANALGVREVVGQFTTAGMTDNADAVNVATMAAQVNGTVLRPGETFSLLDRIGGFGSGYTTAPAYEDGTGPQVRGGGTSQFATTLYNAAYFAGLADAGHTEHPYYLDRYPVARDALAVREDGSAVDLRFTNTSSSGIAIQAVASGSSITVKLWGTKQFRVDSATGQPTGPTPPPVQPQPPGCVPSPGAYGFSATDTRVVYDQATNAVVRQETRTATYSPRPVIVC